MATTTTTTMPCEERVVALLEWLVEADDKGILNNI